MSHIETPIARLRAQAYLIPTDKPEADGTFAWRATTLVVVFAESAGHSGLGYTYADRSATPLILDALAQAVRGLDAMDPPRANLAMRRGMPSHLFFATRALHDVVNAYYAHPAAWNEIGFGGPASPRGYVRLDANRRDPWEAASAEREGEAAARRENKDVV